MLYMKQWCLELNANLSMHSHSDNADVEGNSYWAHYATLAEAVLENIEF